MAVIQLDPARSRGTINRNIYGHFSEHLGRCVYQGLFVGEDSPIPNVKGMRSDVVEALRRIRIPVLRWPGGCFADEYHWEDGIGPKAQRRRMVNTNWGGVVEDNSFGTHEFLELCEQLGCEPYITGNVGSGTVREMAEWVEYLNSDGDSTIANRRRANGREKAWSVKYWGVGNESWGCGGNMRPEYYADEFRRYQTYCRQYGERKLYKIACGPSGGDVRWMEVLMERAGRYMDGISLHHYTVTNDWEKKGSAIRFTTEEYWRCLQHARVMDDLIRRHSEIMDRYDPERRVGLIVDEWGTWHDVEPGTNPGFLYQQNAMRDAMVAAVTLNIFNSHAERVAMANLAQTVNVLQAVILTEGDRMVLTPTYHVFDLYKEHQDARQIACDVAAETAGAGEWTMPAVTASASEKDGKILLTLANLKPEEPEEITVRLPGVRKAAGRMLTGAADAHNTFEASPVAPRGMEGFVCADGVVAFTLPPCCVAAVALEV